MTLDCLYFGLRLLEEKRSASATAPSTVAQATTPYFILKDNILQPRQVRLGECNYDYIEVISGLESGEQVIVSDMTKYKGKEKLKVE